MNTSTEIITLRERLNEKRAFQRYAQQRADEAAELATKCEIELVWANRALERAEDEFAKARKGRWSLWRVF